MAKDITGVKPDCPLQLLPCPECGRMVRARFGQIGRHATGNVESSDRAYRKGFCRIGKEAKFSGSDGSRISL